MVWLVKLTGSIIKHLSILGCGDNFNVGMERLNDTMESCFLRWVIRKDR